MGWPYSQWKTYFDQETRKHNHMHLLIIKNTQKKDKLSKISQVTSNKLVICNSVSLKNVLNFKFLFSNARHAVNSLQKLIKELSCLNGERKRTVRPLSDFVQFDVWLKDFVSISHSTVLHPVCTTFTDWAVSTGMATILIVFVLTGKYLILSHQSNGISYTWSSIHKPPCVKY